MRITRFHNYDLTYWLLTKSADIKSFPIIKCVQSHTMIIRVVTWTLQDITYDKATLDQVMLWCRQATNH